MELNELDSPVITRAERIAAARAALAARRAADPDGVARYEARQAHLAAARKRERERFETLVLGRLPDPAPVGPRPKGMSKAEWRNEKVRRREASVAEQSLAAKWGHKAGTPETLEHASHTHQGALAQLHANGRITDDQLAWAGQIHKASRSIAADVDVKTASLEARVDTSRSTNWAEERAAVVQLHMAYTRWREQIPAPKQLVLDMLTGEVIGYTVAAARWRVGKPKALRLLVEAIDRWPYATRSANDAIKTKPAA